ncbi:MAG TPA: sulfur carrier protein ThiS [Acidimicrobiales bacterium]|nr:sulfur carrier protein ThiS [Acidimicrobiales bacterium]
MSEIGGRGALTVVVNGVAEDVTEGTTVSGVLDTLGLPSRGVAVALNGAVVPRSEWRAARLHSGDKVEILTAAQGG